MRYEIAIKQIRQLGYSEEKLATMCNFRSYSANGRSTSFLNAVGSVSETDTILYAQVDNRETVLLLTETQVILSYIDTDRRINLGCLFSHEESEKYICKSIPYTNVSAVSVCKRPNLWVGSEYTFVLSINDGNTIKLSVSTYLLSFYGFTAMKRAEYQQNAEAISEILYSRIK